MTVTVKECSSTHVEEMRFGCVFQNTEYQIYEVSYPPATPGGN